MKKMKILTITLLIVAITMIAFLGIYIPKQNRMENVMKNYDLAMDLKGSRNIRLKLNTESETVVKDADGNPVEDSADLTEEEMTEKGYTKEEIPNNADEIKTVENYQEAQKVIENRLEKLGASNYIIKVEGETGDIVIELTENDETNYIISNLYTVGKFEIIDSKTEEILMNNSDIHQARVMYHSETTGTSVYLQIEFNKEGRRKLEEISNEYVKIESTTSEDATTEDGNTTEDSETTEETETTAEKEITIRLDDQEILSTSFEEPVRTGKLQLSFGAASADQETLQGYVQQASSLATVLNTGNLPLKYDLDENQYISSDITDNEIAIAIYVILAIVVVAMIILMIRYKALGALGVISYIGFVSLLMIIVRYTNVTISIEGIFGIVIAFILNYILVSQLLAKVNERKSVYKDFFIKIIPIMIMVVTFCFIRWIPISSFGMTMFWGIAFIALYNCIITNSLLKIQTGKEK